MKLVVIDVKKAHFNAKCDEEEWVELSDEFQEVWEVFQAEEMVLWSDKGSVWMEDDHARRLVNDGFPRGRAASTTF